LEDFFIAVSVGEYIMRGKSIFLQSVIRNVAIIK